MIDWHCDCTYALSSSVHVQTPDRLSESTVLASTSACIADCFEIYSYRWHLHIRVYIPLRGSLTTTGMRPDLEDSLRRPSVNYIAVAGPTVARTTSSTFVLFTEDGIPRFEVPRRRYTIPVLRIFRFIYCCGVYSTGPFVGILHGSSNDYRVGCPRCMT